MEKIKIKKQIPVIQIGSTIQQNFGETIKNHGYGIYDVVEDKYTTIDLPNPKPFLSFKIESIDDLVHGNEKLLNN